ncbi:hypothetical protein [Sphingomonas sp. DT-204]|uniref:hypothetical protein n=1 Tax=Sphingomonas sp. DT-204 TaxID=3396166 RepID=UPI003F1DF8CF
MQARLWGAAAACVAMAVASGVGQWRRGRRPDLDRVGLVPWPTIQFAAMMGALILASVALNS